MALMVGALVLGIRHGFDWDHIAAITDITSTAIATDGLTHRSRQQTAEAHIGHDTIGVATDPSAVATTTSSAAGSASRLGRWMPRSRAFALGTLYALGHASVVAALGLAAYSLGAVLPTWVDSVMGPVVGVTLLALGAWLLLAAFRYARYGHEFYFRSRWMLVFDGIRGLRDRVAGRHGPGRSVVASRTRSYGAGTSYGIGMIHGIGAETATQVLLITALGGAAGQGLGIPLMLSFILGLVIANTVIVGISASGFVGTGNRPRLKITAGVLAGVSSITIGLIFVLGWEAGLPDLTQLLGGSVGG